MKTVGHLRSQQYSTCFSGLMETVGSKLSDAEGDYAELEEKLQQIEEYIKKAKTKNKNAEQASIASNSKDKNGEAVKVLYDILLKQDTLTVEEYTLNSCRFKVLVIEDTEL